MSTPSSEPAQQAGMTTPRSDSESPVAALVLQTGAFADAFGRWASRKAVEAGASVPRLRLLNAVHCHGPQKMADLAGALAVTPRNVTALVDGLEAEGLVRRVPHSTDRRVTLVELTCSSDRVAVAVRDVPGLDRGLFAGLTAEDGGRSAAPRDLLRPNERRGLCSTPARRLRMPDDDGRRNRPPDAAGAPNAAPQPDHPGRMPAVYLGHGAPTLIDDELWPVELAAWAAALPRPKSILVVSAHWQSAPLTLGAVTPAPLVYDFYGFPERYYRIRYDSPARPGAGGAGQGDDAGRRAGRPARARPGPRRVRAAADDVPRRGHPGPPDVDAGPRAAAPLRDRPAARAAARRRRADHGQRLHDPRPAVHPRVLGRPRRARPNGRRVRPLGGRDARAGDLDALFDFRNRAPGCRTPTRRSSISRRSSWPSARRRTRPGAEFTIEGYWLGLAKRSFQVR
jgi:4,5-DOPA dioxygenase extradiol